MYGNMDSSVGIATSYGLDGLGSIPGKRQEIILYSAASRQSLGSTQLPTEWVPWGYFPLG
jgi:hypothetical protein